jgi:drug/metabolite transporter (DMT)-like permease
MKNSSSGTGFGPSQRLGLAALVAGALVSAFAPVFARLSETGPIATGFWRVLIAAPVLWMAVIGRRDEREGMQDRLGRDFAIMALAGAMLAADLAVWHISLQFTSVANATLFNNTVPLFVVLIGFVLGQRPRGGFMAALAAALFGMAMLVAGHADVSARSLAGDGMALSTGLFYALYIVALSSVRLRRSTALAMAVSTSAAAPILLVAALLAGETLWPSSGAGWAMLIALGLVCHVCGQSLITFGLGGVKPALASLILLLQPVAAAIFAVPLFDETLGWVQIVGMALVLAAIAVARRFG